MAVSLNAVKPTDGTEWTIESISATMARESKAPMVRSVATLDHAENVT